MPDDTVRAGATALPEMTDTSEPDYLIEPYNVSPTFFTGARVYTVGGVVHLIFYVEQPSSAGQIEHVLVDRLMAPSAIAKSVIDELAKALTRRPITCQAPESLQ